MFLLLLRNYHHVAIQQKSVIRKYGRHFLSKMRRKQVYLVYQYNCDINKYILLLIRNYDMANNGAFPFKRISVFGVGATLIVLLCVGDNLER